MHFADSPEEQMFREEVRTWLAEHLVGAYRSLGATAAVQEGFTDRLAWERELGKSGWVGLSWPREHGGRAATLTEELIFAQEYARAKGPTRVGYFGESLVGPTLMTFGSGIQQRRFLPRILAGEELWCQGFSEPSAGSDLASVRTSARLDGDQWVVDGQKLWTSYAQFADWIFLLARTDAEPPAHRGLSFLLLPVDQPGITVRPLVEMTGGRHFNEVFFDGARTDADLIVGQPGDGWKVAMGTLGFERGAALLGQQVHFAMELQALVDLATRRGLTSSPVVRQRLARAYAGIEIMRLNGLRAVTRLNATGVPGPEASVGKLEWSQWHQRLGELAMDILGAEALLDDDDVELQAWKHTFLFSRSHTIYAGSSEIQRNIVGERVLGLPREPA